MAKKLIILVLALAALNLWQWQQRSELLEDKRVIKVPDGDSIVLATQQEIRLSNLEAPELGFCGGEEAKERLEELVLEKVVDVQIISHGQFRRQLGLVSVDGALVNRVMLEEGLARYDGSPSPFRDELKAAYDKAVEERRGIFGPECLSLEPDKKGCLIKGNVSRQAKSDKTFHFPGCSGYEGVMVEKDLGEDWFCSEEEAKEAGFVKSKNCFGRKF